MKERKLILLTLSFCVLSLGSSVIVPEEGSIHSIPEEEKFHSSFAEEELKHDYRMVLPSENHRRKSFGQKEYIISGCESSSVSTYVRYVKRFSQFVNKVLMWNTNLIQP